MRITLFAVGRLKVGPENELAGRYLDRFAKSGPAIGLEFARTVEVQESRALNPEKRKRDEAVLIEKALPDGSVLVLLDERGTAMASEDLARQIGQWRDGGRRDLMFAVGGADGLDQALWQRADLVLNLGKLTWPHQIVRVLIAEQLYRVVTILSGHPYHRA